VHSDDDQSVVSIGLRPGTDVRLRAQPVDAGQRPEVDIAAGERQRPGIFELLGAPGFGEAVGIGTRRGAMAPDRGMIFLFPYESPQSFWMKNTILPLDMIFINSDKKIVGIVEQAVPFSLDPRAVPAASQFVLEINGGLAKRYGLRPGDQVRFEGIEAAAVKE
jgi:uncharacterized membrane protein (UPF0127 family)